jgi:TolB-like protein/Tfp pilus assembly protein PilF
MGESGPPALVKPPPATPSPGRLDSWKEIAAYLKRDVTTAQRWEKREGMPVHRHLHDRSGSVYAFASELDTWLKNRKPSLQPEDKQTVPLEPDSSDASPPDPDRVRSPATWMIPMMRRWLTLGSFAILALAALTYVIGRSHARNAVRPQIRSLAVLPLKNLSGDAAQEYLADGMTEALIGHLSGIHDLRVISRTSIMSFKETRLPVPEIAKALHVDAIVEGSVIRQGSRIRVHAQLIRASTDEHFWSEAYDRELRDVLALQSDVAQAIANKVQATVTGEEYERLTAAHSVSPEVYENYLQGRFALDKSNSKADIERSVGYFDEAIRRDSSFAPAYVGLATSYAALSTIFIGLPPEQPRAKLISATQKALELDPQSAEAHVLLADIRRAQWLWAESEAEYKRALALNPSNSAAYLGFAWWLLCRGRFDDALTWAKRGREIDPLAVSGSLIGWILFCDRRYDEAIREFQSVLPVRPSDANALWDLGFALIANGQATQAIPPLEKALAVSDRSPGVMGVLVRAYAHAGRRTDALRLLAELRRRSQTGYVPAGAFLNAYLGLGDNQQAFAWLERAYQERSNTLQFMKVHPYFDPLRDDPRFADLLRRVGLN